MKTKKPKTKPTITKVFIGQMERHRDRIGIERDALCDMMHDIEGLVDTCERGLEALDDAISILSEQA